MPPPVVELTTWWLAPVDIVHKLLLTPGISRVNRLSPVITGVYWDYNYNYTNWTEPPSMVHVHPLRLPHRDVRAVSTTRRKRWDRAPRCLQPTPPGGWHSYRHQKLRALHLPPNYDYLSNYLSIHPSIYMYDYIYIYTYLNQ